MLNPRNLTELNGHFFFKYHLLTFQQYIPHFCSSNVPETFDYGNHFTMDWKVQSFIISVFIKSCHFDICMFLLGMISDKVYNYCNFEILCGKQAKKM